MTLIADIITRRSRHAIVDPALAESGIIAESFVPTTEARAFCSRVAGLVASASDHAPRALLLIGERGTGKTHLARCLESFLAYRQDPKWKDIWDSVPDSAGARRRGEFLYFNVPVQPSMDIAGWFIEKLSGRSGSDLPPSSVHEISAADFVSGLRKGADAAALGPASVLVVDGMSRRISRLVDEVRIRREIEICRELAAVVAERGVLAIIIADEEHLHQGPSKAAPFGNLKAHCDTCRLSRMQIEEVIASTLAYKENARRVEVRKILGYLRERLTRFAPKTETFEALYPIHPQAFAMLFPLRTVLPEFSPLAFARAAIEQASSRASAHLVTHETVFDFALQDMRCNAECAPILQSFDELCTSAVPRLGQPLQARARALLKAIALETICDLKPATVVALANGLLLFDETQALPAYGLTAAILMEIEEQGRGLLAGEGDGFERTYRLSGQQRHAASSGSQGQEVLRSDLRVRIPQLIYDWFRAELPPWRPNPNPKYWRTSLSLLAPIPESPKRRIGMVYFKNVLDPFWSQDDLQILQTSPHRWILLVLSPFEHFYEFETDIVDIAGSSPKIMVWHPDVPTPSEAEQLERLAADYPWPPESVQPGKPSGEAHEILSALYVRRGKFITSQGQWSVGEGLKNLTLVRYLSERLNALCIRSADGAPAEAEAREESPADRYADEAEALKWAALLSGEEDLRNLDLESAETRLLAWWLSAQEIDASTLAAKLNPLPEILMTTRFAGEYRQFVRQLELLQPTFQLLSSKSISFCEAMSQVCLHFNRDEALLRRWKLLNVELAGLARWLPALEHMREYLNGAFYTSMDQVDQLRSRLLQLLDQPNQFLSADKRDLFDRSFLEFKTLYIDCYNARHEEAMQIAGSGKQSGLRIDMESLRNLELLSRLQHADRGYINRVHVIARWLRANQCALPVRRILERSPHCFCNFNPAVDPRLGVASDRLNTLISQGLEYFRTAMCKCREHVIEELKRMHVDQASAQQIAPLLGSGALFPLTPGAIEILNQTIEKHPQPFMAAFVTRSN